MRLTDLFGVEDLVPGFGPADKWQAIRELVDHLVSRGRLDAARSEEVLDAVLSREKSMSTGMERGVAIPHAAVDDLDSVVACMGLISGGAGLPFESLDGQPARVVVLLVIPRAQKLLHIRTLADVARVLAREEVRVALLEAPDAAAAYEVLARSET
jgi:fructose PTS system EIIA component